MRSGVGLLAPIRRRLFADAEYAVSRIGSPTGVTVQGVTFGIGVRF